MASTCFVVWGRVTAIPNEVFNRVDNFRTELPNLFVGQEPVQPH